MSNRIAWFFVGIVGAGWFLSEIVFPAVIHDYTPPPGISAAVGSISGVLIALMAAQAATGNRQTGNGNGNGGKGNGRKPPVIMPPPEQPSVDDPDKDELDGPRREGGRGESGG